MAVCKQSHCAQEMSLQSAPISLSKDYKREFESSILLGFSGFSRYSSEIAQKKIDKMKDLDKVQIFDEISEISNNALQLFENEADIESIGDLVHSSWVAKRSLVDGISLPEVDEIYDAGRKNGAFGGKLMGAGGGGFFISSHRKISMKRSNRHYPRSKSGFHTGLLLKVLR